MLPFNLQDKPATTGNGYGATMEQEILRSLANGVTAVPTRGD